MTRQLIICSALIASVAAPAMAGTVTVTNRGGVTREIGSAAFTRTTNPAGLVRATNTAELLRHPIPVDIMPRFSNPASMFDFRRGFDSIKASDAAALLRASNPAGLFRFSNPASVPRHVIHPDMIMIPKRSSNPVESLGYRLICWSNAAARDAFGACERIVHDPPMTLHR